MESLENFEAVENLTESPQVDLAERIKDQETTSSEVRRLISRYGKICLFSLGLLGVDVGNTSAQEPTAQKIESVAQGIELPKLRPNEYIMPDTVMSLYRSNIGSKKSIKESKRGVERTTGLYIERGDEDRKLKLFLNLLWYRGAVGRLKQHMNFDRELSELPISQDSINTLKSRYFQAENILIIKSQTDSKENFSHILFHERIHKYIAEDLTNTERDILMKARNQMVAEWKKYDDETTNLFHQFQEGGGIEKAFTDPKYFKIQSEIISRRHILDKVHDNSNYSKYYAMDHEDEFYSSLMSSKNQEGLTEFLDYFKTNFPEAHEIFIRIRNKAISDN